MTTNTIRSVQPLLEATQANAHATVNRLLNLHDVGLAGGLRIIDRDLTTAPGSPSNGDTYLIPASGLSGVWASYASKIAIYFDGWYYFTPLSGMIGFVSDEKVWIGYSSVESQWHYLQDSDSSTEHWTGKYRAGSKVYAKTISLGTLPNATTVNTAHGISSIDFSKGVKIEGYCYDTSPAVAFTIPIASLNTGAAIDVVLDGTNVIVTTNFDASGLTGVVRIEYFHS